MAALTGGPLPSYVAGEGRPVVVLPSLSLDAAAMRLAFEPAFPAVRLVPRLP